MNTTQMQQSGSSLFLFSSLDKFMIEIVGMLHAVGAQQKGGSNEKSSDLYPHIIREAS